jgi:hypothetical protein
MPQTIDYDYLTYPRSLAGWYHLIRLSFIIQFGEKEHSIMVRFIIQIGIVELGIMALLGSKKHLWKN